MITPEEKAWTEKAVDTGFTRLQIEKKLMEANKKSLKIKEVLKYYDSIVKDLDEGQEERDLTDEEEFKEEIKDYFDGKDMGFFQKRKIKKFLKSLKAYKDMLDVAITGIKKEVEEIKNNVEFDNKRKDKEMESLKLEMIDRIIDSKQIFDIEDPLTGEEATVDNLKKNDLNTLLNLLQINVEALQQTIDGKIE